MSVRSDRMARFSRERIASAVRGISVRQVRLACGMILFAYLVSHFLNHALGNISIDALATGVHYHGAFWQFLPVAIVFYGAALVHTGLGVWAFYERRQFRWKAIEPLQLVLGLTIPALVIAHIAGVRLGQTLFEQQKLYPQVLYAYWVVWPYKILQMFAVLLIAWIHGCIGLYFWLRMKAFYKRAAAFLLAAAVLVPTLAMLGLYQAGRTVVAVSEGGQWKADNLSQNEVGTPAEQQVLESIVDYFLICYFGLIGLVVLARGVRALAERRAGMINLSYGNGRTVRVPKGLSILEASLRYNVPHPRVWGGPRSLLDLPNPRDRRSSFLAGAFGARGVCPQPRRGDRPFDPSGMPTQARERSFVLPAIRASVGIGAVAGFATTSDRPGALSREHVRRYAWIDQTRRKSAAVRYGVHRQPLPRRGVESRHRMRRPTQPVRRRRTARVVWAV